jgi:Uma2 family endonuclease
MFAAGILDDDHRVELVDGMVVEMSPPGPEHARVVEQLNKLLVTAVGDSLRVRVQDTFLTREGGFVLPDLMVLERDGADRLPETALLVIEVSSTSRARDLEKVATYAAAGVREYWIVDLDQSVVLVHRDPTETTYASIERFVSADRIAPLLAGVPPVDVAGLLAS